MRESANRPRPLTGIMGALGEPYFYEAGRTFERAARAAGGVDEMFIELAGIRICLRGAGDGVLPHITGTLAHLEVQPGGPVDFTICCWDHEATGNGLPMPEPWMLEKRRYCSLVTLTDERFRTFYIDWMQSISCIDMETNVAYCGYQDIEHLLMYEISSPLRSILGTILNRKGMQIVHASAIGTPAGSVLFVGPPRSGKSTLAVLCLRDGLSYQSDDLCVLSDEEHPKSFCIYNIAKLREDAVGRFETFQPHLSWFREDHAERKAYFYVHQHLPAQVLKEAPVRALVIPQVANGPASRLRRARPMEMVGAVVECTKREIPASDELGWGIMLRAVSRLPAYRMQIGRDERQTLAVIRRLLDGL